MRSHALISLLLAALLTACVAPPPAAPRGTDRRPNIVLIMADDLGIEGLGGYGGTSYATPRLDALAAAGLRFTHAYAQPLCTPTRVQLMTGLYNHRNWEAFGILPQSATTFGHLMQRAGYATCIAGKWQLQSYDPPDFPGAQTRRGTGMHAADAGFDAYRLFHALHTEDKGSRYANPTYLENGVLHQAVEGAYGEDLSADFIIDFMTRHRDQPVFAYYPMALPHGPFNPTPHSAAWSNPADRLERDKRYFADMVAYLDHTVGRLVDAIDNLGLAEDTLILFYSDNGTPGVIQSHMGERVVDGGKATPHQTGIRVPLIAYRPGTVRPGVTDHLVDASDFLPTLLELAAAGPPPATDTTPKLDGHSFAPVLTDAHAPPARDACFFWYDPRPGSGKKDLGRHVFALDHRYKLYRGGGLYDIAGPDPIESPLDPDTLTPDAQAARHRLQGVIDRTMQSPVSSAARRPPDKD